MTDETQVPTGDDVVVPVEGEEVTSDEVVATPESTEDAM